jgi:hypothetical protein
MDVATTDETSLKSDSRIIFKRESCDLVGGGIVFFDYLIYTSRVRYGEGGFLMFRR